MNVSRFSVKRVQGDNHQSTSEQIVQLLGEIRPEHSPSWAIPATGAASLGTPCRGPLN